MHDLNATLYHSDHNLFRSDVVEGPFRLQKTIPCRWPYDARGSHLFEEIPRLEDYYPTRAAQAWEDDKRLFSVFALSPQAAGQLPG